MLGLAMVGRPIFWLILENSKILGRIGDSHAVAKNAPKSLPRQPRPKHPPWTTPKTSPMDSVPRHLAPVPACGAGCTPVLERHKHLTAHLEASRGGSTIAWRLRWRSRPLRFGLGLGRPGRVRTPHRPRRSTSAHDAAPPSLCACRRDGSAWLWAVAAKA
eukprot:SAG22_NODE_10377_length_538_cov_1.749431_1_plen_159_part_01